MGKTIVGLYDNAEKARDAVNALVAAGCPREDISLVAKEPENIQKDTSEQGNKAPEGLAAGAGIGAALGGLGGVLAGLGLLAIPGIGPIVAAGPIAAGLAGAAGGAVAGGLLGGLLGLGIPEEEAHAYAEGVRRGNTLVTVRAPEGQADSYAAIMNRFGPIDVKSRAAQWRQQGWSGRFEEGAQQATIPLAEEQLVVGKRAVETGGVRVHSYVTEQPVREQVTLHQEKVNVERMPADRPVGAGEGAFTERSVEMSGTAEEPVVSKRARIREEVKLSKQEEEHEEEVSETVRKTDVDIEPLPGSGPSRDRHPHR